MLRFGDPSRTLRGVRVPPPETLPEAAYRFVTRPRPSRNPLVRLNGWIVFLAARLRLVFRTRRKPMKRLTLFATCYAAALVMLAAAGCVNVNYKPTGEVRVSSFLKDVQIGEADFKRPDGTEFHLKGYDGKSKTELAEKALDVAKEALK